MLTKFKLKLENAVKSAKVFLIEDNIYVELQAIGQYRFEGVTIIHNSQNYQYIIDGQYMYCSRNINFEDGTYKIIYDDLKSMNIINGVKTIKFTLIGNFQWPFVPHICGSILEVGNWNPLNSYSMIQNGNKWEALLKVEKSFEYKFIILNMLDKNPYIKWENRQNRLFNIIEKEDYIEINSNWDSLTTTQISKKIPKFIFIQIHYKVDKTYQHICIVGNTKETGYWNPQKGKVMQRNYDYWWKCCFTTEENEFQFKFVLRNGNTITWEEGSNRVIELEDGQFCNLTAKWNYQNDNKICWREYNSECPVCCQIMSIEQVAIGQLCGHQLCKQCYFLISDGYFQKKKCPICRKQFLL